MFQLHPFYATVTRPVYQDRDGYLFIQVDCPECNGEGSFHVSPINPSERDRDVTCECCGGFSKVMKEIEECDLQAAA